MSERGRFLWVKWRRFGAMGDHQCPKCGNNTFQVQSSADHRRGVTFICIGCWSELRLEDMARQFFELSRQLRKG